MKEQQVGDARKVGRTLKQLRRAHQRLHRGVTTVARAIDAHALRIGNTLLHSPGNGIGQIILHRQTPLFVARELMLEAQAGGAAKIGLNHRVAARGKKLRFGIPPPTVRRHPRPAMHDQNQRQLLARRVLRQRQQRRQRQLVTRREFNDARFRHLRGFQPGARVDQKLKLPGAKVVQIYGASIAIRVRAHQHTLALLGRQKHIDCVRQPLIDLPLQCRPGVVQPCNGVPLSDVAHTYQLFGNGVEHRLRHVVLVTCRQHLLRLPLLVQTQQGSRQGRVGKRCGRAVTEAEANDGTVVANR